MWRILQNAIPVKSALNKRGIPCNILCPRCFLKEETTDHTFMHCEHVSKVWFGSKLSINFHNTQASFAEWLRFAIINLKKEDLIYIASIIYGIWYARNQQVFENKTLTDTEVLRIADTNIHDYIIATNNDDLYHPSKGQPRSTSHQQGATRNRSNQWRRPDERIIKVNSDASLTTAGKWGLGVTCRDNTGMITAAATWEIPGNNDPLLAEAYALYHAVRFAIDCCFQSVIFESDNERLIKLLGGVDQIPRNYVGNIVRGIKCNRDSFRFCNFQHIYRESNQTAHHLAIWAHSEPNMMWIEENPPAIVPYILKDLIHQ
ncbi:Ribonuclease H superfamily protein [Trifolium repens]|nr:Ribonuclease H superfamily protein [Trifolium repens]